MRSIASAPTKKAGANIIVGFHVMRPGLSFVGNEALLYEATKREGELPMDSDKLRSVAKAIVSKQKGVLAADESNPTIKKRFDSIKVESTEENRRRYREILFTTEGIEHYIGGVILFDETLRQGTRDGTPFAELLSSRGILPGIKVDKGAQALSFFPEEKIAEGLDGLRERLVAYKQMGAKFAKWRAVIEINERDVPTAFGIRANAHVLARYAALCQELGIVPIVEPEVLMDGAHDIERCEIITSRVLEAVFTELDAHRVLFEGMLLKPNMGYCRHEMRASGKRAAGCRGHDSLHAPLRAGGCPWNRIPVRWAERGRRH